MGRQVGKLAAKSGAPAAGAMYSHLYCAHWLPLQDEAKGHVPAKTAVCGCIGNGMSHFTYIGIKPEDKPGRDEIHFQKRQKSLGSGGGWVP